MDIFDVITIDGSSFTGKSTTARALARMTGYQPLNTGAIYRAVGFLKQRNNIPDDDIQQIVKMVQGLKIRYSYENEAPKLMVDDEDLSFVIKDSSLVPLAAQVAGIPAVREALLQIQRDIAAKGKYIVEGRDTGTIVFPNARWKFFIDADIDVKVARFFKTLSEEEKKNYTFEQVKKMLIEVDEKDRARKVAPLRQAEDAIFYDNSESPTPEQDAVVLWYHITHAAEIKKNYPNILSRLK